jgi:hypothetical protein
MPRADSPYGPDWQRLRARFLHHHRVCRLCSAPAKHVDHIVPVRRAPERRLDWTNLQPLCAEHHNRLTNAFDTERQRGCDETGRPFDQKHPWARDGLAKTRPQKQDWVRATLDDLAAGKKWRGRNNSEW